jgi:excisionase family DNA binding protein
MTSTNAEGEAPDPEAVQAPAELRLYTVEEVMTMLRVGRDTIFGLIRNNRLHSVQEGRSRRFTARQIADYIALLEREAAARRVA